MQAEEGLHATENRKKTPKRQRKLNLHKL